MTPPLQKRAVFVTGGTGYLGRALLAQLALRGHAVRALVRAGSEAKLPRGCEPVLGDALDARTFADRVAPCDSFVQLVGVAHPSPWKAELFRTVDLAAGRAGVEAARLSGAAQFVYVSVAQPAPAMKAYVAVRAEVEQLIRESGLDATILRPWYVIGEGHRWPLVLVPLYALLERLPATRESAVRLGFVRHAAMVAALLRSIEEPAHGVRILDTRAIRAAL